ncbi:TPA: transposase [Legionella pneumophila]|nr:transposase [Legionella pneumophila]
MGFWDTFSYSKFGITEGFHRKMKLIQRRAYGFRNFENYRLRVRVLCG